MNDRPSYRMPFGKYRGIALADLPNDYLDWLCGLSDLRPILRAAVDAEHRRRTTRATARATASCPDLHVLDALITSGYRALAKQHHPDHGGDHTMMVAVTQAAEWLRATVRGLSA